MRTGITMALRGVLSGTLRMSGRDGAIALRGKSPVPARAYFICEDGSVFGSDISPDMRCGLPAGRVCAAAVFDSGARLISRGTLGVCGRNAGGRLTELRMRAASDLRMRAASDLRKDPAPDVRARETSLPVPRDDARSPEGEAPGPRAPFSAVTEGILARARGLFSASGGSVTDALPSDPAPEIEAVRNPFPRSYPNSYWQRTAGEARLTGTAETPRGRIILRAVPGSRAYRPLGFERYLIGADGRGWWVHEQR